MHLRLLTYNIHKCIGGLDRRYDPLRIAETISYYKPDVVMLQEVGVGVPSAPGSKEKQSDILGGLLGYRHRAFVSQASSWAGGPYGNAILSRYPILESHHIDLTIPLKKRRGAIHARIRVRLPSGQPRTLHVYNMHLGLSGIERNIQLKRFLKSDPFSHLHAQAPIIVGGDFNDVWGTLGAKILAPAGFLGTPPHLFTFPAFAPLRALDALYMKGDLELIHAQRGHINIAHSASDHLPLIADIFLK